MTESEALGVEGAGGHRAGRLDRRIPGQLTVSGRLLVERLAAREPEEAIHRKVAGETFKGSEHASRAARRLAEVTPNAPLLMRLVLHPFALGVVRGVRAATREPVPWAAIKVERTVIASAVARAERVHFERGGPLVSLDDRRTARPPRPSVDLWLATRDHR